MLRWCCLWAYLIVVWQQAAPVAAATERTDRFFGLQALRHASLDRVRYDTQYGGIRLSDDAAGGFHREGGIIFEHLRYSGGFNEVIPSWNTLTPSGTGVTVAVAVSADGGANWSRWRELARWGSVPVSPRGVSSEGLEGADEWVKVDADTLLLNREGDRLKVNVRLYSEQPDRTPTLRMLSLAVRGGGGSERAMSRHPSKAWGKELFVRHRSQGEAPPDQSWRVCGPTSLTMALAACGVNIPLEAVITRCWDARNEIYGNWAFLAAAGSSLLAEHWQRLPGQRPPQPGSHAGRVDWASDWNSVENEILHGHPCLLSIHYQAGELPGAPVAASDGHLVMVSGFTKTGDVIVHDPAGRSAAAGRVVYDRAQLHRARHGGPAILLCPNAHHGT